MPAVPSIALRLTEFEDELDALLAWDAQIPSAVVWARRLNELRFVRATLAWETYLEESFICYLRNAMSTGGKAFALAVPPPPNLADARALAIGAGDYGNWLSERFTQRRASALFHGANPYGILAAALFTEIRQTRNRIVHRSASSQKEFNSVLISNYGALRRGYSPGAVSE